jgi:phenylacetate-CoA ligase
MEPSEPIEYASTYDRWSDLLAFIYTNQHSSFYRGHYTKAGFDPVQDFKGLKDLSVIPCVTKQDLLSVPCEQLRFVPESDVRSISSTSGTTSGTPLLTYYSPTELTEQTLKPEHSDFGTTLLLFGPMRAGSVLHSYHQRNQVAILGDVHNLPASCAFAAHAGVRTITTTPTLAIILKKFIDAQPALAKNLRYLRLGGEVMSPAKKAYLQNLYPGVTLFSVYASSEVGWAAFQCIHLAQEDTILYHPNLSGFHIEIVDDELVVTDFNNQATPLVRYRTGDRARWMDRTCPCGKPGQLLSLEGRIDYDSIRAGGFEIRRDMIEIPILKLQHLIMGDFEAHVYETYNGEKPSIRMVLRVALQQSTPDSMETKRTIIEEFNRSFRFSPTLSFQQAQEMNLFQPLEIEFVEFPNKAKATQKIILH